ncbi:hypothetical protein CK203_018396 [Vitis vinifera]|uniref:Reverse transcriptase RNase H-like domain-containing protein n=1 Tax=Vitis vinifera TaxID=29760 RepID=A0A438J6B5_VITVI|nr:hypothetical protein CK203_018396 [Vitis vinifera]
MGNQRRSIPLPSPKEQKPIYYVSRALADVETRYSKMELTALALRSAAQKLRPYFQAHPVIVLTDSPSQHSAQTRFNRRMLQWAIELSEFGIEFQPRLSMKGQVMADFVLEYSRRPSQHHESVKRMVDSASGASRSSSGVGLLLQSPTGNIWSKPSGWDSLPLTMKQNMRPSCPDWTSPLLYPSPNSGSTATHNSWRADALAGIAASLPSKKPFYCLYMCKPTLCRRNLTCNTIEATKQTPRMDDTLQNTPDRHSTRRSQTGTQSPVQAARFTLIGGLYKRSFTGPYLRCLGHSEAQYVLAELHEGICGNHSGGRSLAQSSFARILLANNEERCGSICPWPFAQWGMDIVGPLPAALPRKIPLVATDYFSKWVEAEAYASIKDKDVTNIAFRNFCSELNIRNSYSTPYPQMGEELPGVLWAYRTTPGRPTGNTPFALAYGMDAVIPTEIGLPTIRTDAAKQNDANTELGRNLDWADEVRESAAIRMADYQQRASAHYNRKGNSKLTGKDPI